ncbi:MAG: zinc-binding dehydrogenase [Bacteroidales bacterium]|nr:zinc-binding dehydrogenase [Bacteroidales bacterium]
MKAVVLDKPCKAEDMILTEVSVPKVKQGWILIRIKAFGLNHSEVILRQFEIENDYIQKPIIPGIECVGEVEESLEKDFVKGDKVMALMGGMGRSFNGSYAEFCLVPTSHCFHIKNTTLSWTSLAAVGETYFTAWGSLFESLNLQPQDHLLVRGSTSTVGQSAVQIASKLGCRVTAAARNDTKFDLLKSIGATDCIIDDKPLSTSLKEEDKPTKILELIGPKTLIDSLHAVKKGGIVCNTGVLGDVFTLRDFEPIKSIPNEVFLSAFYSNYPTQQTIDGIFAFIDKYNLTPLVSKIFPFKDISTAHSILEAGKSGGKIVIEI